jgi:tubulysin polyketide synthase-like protein
MSVATDLLEELSRRGVAVRADGETIRLKPRVLLNEGLLSRVKAHKPEILAVLSALPARCSPTCYEIEPGEWIHHPWDGCKTCLTLSREKPLQKVESVCWHCNGERVCPCSTCWNPATGGPSDCAACKGTGKVWQ